MSQRHEKDTATITYCVTTVLPIFPALLPTGNYSGAQKLVHPLQEVTYHECFLELGFTYLKLHNTFII